MKSVSYKVYCRSTLDVIKYGKVLTGDDFDWMISIDLHHSGNHRQPKLTLRAAHKLDCFFHAMHNNDIGTLCIIMNRQHLRVCMEMLQSISNCHKSERSRNKNNLPYFIIVLAII